MSEEAWNNSEEMRQLRHDLRTMQADSAARTQTENVREEAEEEEAREEDEREATGTTQRQRPLIRGGD